MSSAEHEPLLYGPRIGEEDASDTGNAKRVTWASESKYLLLLSAPAIIQLAGQQGLVVCNQVKCV